MPNWWDQYQDHTPSQSLPRGGDPTSATGQSAAGMVTPGRYDPETMRAFAIDLMANGGKGASGILNNDPGQQYARTYANTQATNQANLKNTQNAIRPLEDRIDDFARLAEEAGPEVLKLATGPNYHRDGDKNQGVVSNSINALADFANGIMNGNLAMATGQDTASQAYQASRAARLGSGDDSNPNKYDKALSLNTKLQHLRDAIGAAVKAVPGSKNSSTDQDQALVLDMVGKALNAPDDETFFRILHDAKNTLRGRGQLPALPEEGSYLPQSWRDIQSDEGLRRLSFTKEGQEKTFGNLPKGWKITKVD